MTFADSMLIRLWSCWQHKGFTVCWFIFILTNDDLVRKTAMLNMWYTYEIIQLQNAISIRTSREKQLKKFYYKIYFVILCPDNFIKLILLFAQVSNVSHWPLVMNTHWKIVGYNTFAKETVQKRFISEGVLFRTVIHVHQIIYKLHAYFWEHKHFT